MRIFTTIVAILAGLVLAGVAQASVSVNGHRVSVELVGAISAQPCNDSDGCARGIVTLNVDGAVASDHLVACPRPRHLAVLRATARYAYVRACVKRHPRLYQWAMP